MKNIITAKQTRTVDSYTIEHLPISDLALMEKAAMAFVKAVIPSLSKQQLIHIFCGTGNNGGDGFAIARLLIEEGYGVKTYLIPFSKQLSSSCAANFKRLNDVVILDEKHTNFIFRDQDIVIDAIFGSGLSRPITGFVADIIHKINHLTNHIISVDIPSGLYADKPSEGDVIIHADKTISFQRPKLSFFLPGYGDYVNDWQVVDIGLMESYITTLKSDYYWIQDEPEKWIKRRKKFSHKGNYGHAYLVVGSYGRIGAAILASRACLGHGVGYLTVHVPRCGYEIMQISVPRAMCTIDEEEKFITNIPIEDRTYGIGPGLSLDKKTEMALIDLLKSLDKPVVLDADALNMIATNKEIIQYIPKNSILTPHPKEFSRLVGKANNSFERLAQLQKFAQENQFVTVLKGAHTAIANIDGKVFFNTTGGPELAQAGSGDVLTGIITSYLAQGLSPIKSAILGVYKHGKGE